MPASAPGGSASTLPARHLFVASHAARWNSWVAETGFEIVARPTASFTAWIYGQERAARGGAAVRASRRGGRTRLADAMALSATGARGGVARRGAGAMTPSVSVVIVPGNRRDRAARSLASVLDQEGIERAEIGPARCGQRRVAAAPTQRRSRRPRSLPGPQRGTYGELRAEGTRLARAPIVAFLEEHAIGLPGWLAAIEESLATGEYCGASGEVHPLNPGSGISDAVGLMNYARWLPPLTERGPSRLVVGHNSAYRRDGLLAFGDDLERLLWCEVVLQWQFGARGQRFLINPEIRLAHLNETTMAAICKGYYLWNVRLGAEWANQNGWSTYAAREPGGGDPLVGDPAHGRPRPHGAGTAGTGARFVGTCRW